MFYLHMELTERDTLLKNIRPILNLPFDTGSEIATFQMKTLRPICKFQNDSAIIMLRDYLEMHNVKLSTLTFTAQKEKIRNLLKTDVTLKNRLIMLVAGMFTIEEWRFYHKFRSDVNKRIIELFAKRISDQIELLN